MTKPYRLAVLMGLLALSSALPAKDKKPVDPNKRICRADSSSTGSIMPRQICHTAAEWAQIDGSVRDPGPAAGDLRGMGGSRAGYGN